MKSTFKINNDISAKYIPLCVVCRKGELYEEHQINRSIGVCAKGALTAVDLCVDVILIYQRAVHLLKGCISLSLLSLARIQIQYRWSCVLLHVCTSIHNHLSLRTERESVCAFALERGCISRGCRGGKRGDSLEIQFETLYILSDITSVYINIHIH